MTAQSPDDRSAGSTAFHGDIRERIVAAAVDLLNSGGRDTVTTRAVAAAASVQPPAIYRLFGDMHGLLGAVAEHGFTTYLAEKATRMPGQDSVQDLRIGWDLHIEFGLSHPEIYLLMYAEPKAGAKSPAAEIAFRILRKHIRRVAADGRLRFSEERAADLFHAFGCGTVLTLLAKAEGDRDMDFSEIAREAAIAAITTDAPTRENDGPLAAAVALRAALPDVQSLSVGERSLLTEWLDRLAAVRR